ncbi:ribosomal-protein-alanine N-acetyltransferase [Floricoccus penangensis]|uniref:[Ribosomal protein bS18]-alanine N-acetyltransferase n=1 Tax=Floricoccus penangensis TaxID=1859475 RepID=A0A9Q5P0K9_9LACT|nr:ribosomal protein S18-alanine N-acetyltransferase [Floricoccus penangensis]OFI46445.1 ribosomal-protein-alanine N-acetyltransferase [Floricoccus penangensis]
MRELYIKRINPDLDCLRDIAIDVHLILSDVYDTPPWTFEQTFSDLLKVDTIYFLAYHEEKPIGFLSAVEVMDEIEITNVAVIQDFRGQGISSDLLSRLLKFDGTFFLEVRKSNEVAKSLYKKYNFQAFHERKNYYKNPTEDAILMRLERL